MIGAIAGDIIGSVYEWHNIKTTDFKLFSPHCFFTDDSVHTVALAESILTGTSYTDNLKSFSRRYPHAGYGSRFAAWAFSDSVEPYNSWGNGSAMRTSPVGFAYETLEETLAQAEQYAAVTHNHPEGIKGAQAVSACIFLARNATGKDEIRSYVIEKFGYNLSPTLDEIRPSYSFNESCQGTVPQAITAFLESTGFESAIRNAISLGGDSDTLACITGGIAQAAFGLPLCIKEKVYSILDEYLGNIVCLFEEYMGKYIRTSPTGVI